MEKIKELLDNFENTKKALENENNALKKRNLQLENEIKYIRTFLNENDNNSILNENDDDSILNENEEIDSILNEIKVGYPSPINYSNKRELALDLVKSDGLYLKCLPEKYKNDREIILAAVKSNAFALLCFNYDPNNSNIVDKEIAEEAVKNDGRIINERILTEYRQNKEIILLACKTYPYAVTTILTRLPIPGGSPNTYKNYIQDPYEAFLFAKDCIKVNICCALYIPIDEYSKNFKLHKLAINSKFFKEHQEKLGNWSQNTIENRYFTAFSSGSKFN